MLLCYESVPVPFMWTTMIIILVRGKAHVRKNNTVYGGKLTEKRPKQVFSLAIPKSSSPFRKCNDCKIETYSHKEMFS